MSGRERIETKVREVLAQVLDVPVARIGPGFGESSTSSWTSINHLMLVSELEAEFGILFSNLEIREIGTFERIVEAIACHLPAGH